MAAPTIQAVMEGLETRLATISGLRVQDIQPDQVNLPAAYVGLPETVDYRAAFQRGLMALDMRVTVIVSAASDRVGQHALAAYANPTGTSSVIAAVEGDKTLGGVVSDCVVRTFKPLGLINVGGIEAYAGEWVVTVYAQGS